MAEYLGIGNGRYRLGREIRLLMERDRLAGKRKPESKPDDRPLARTGLVWLQIDVLDFFQVIS